MYHIDRLQGSHLAMYTRLSTLRYIMPSRPMVTKYWDGPLEVYKFHVFLS